MLQTKWKTFAIGFLICCSLSTWWNQLTASFLLQRRVGKTKGSLPHHFCAITARVMPKKGKMLPLSFCCNLICSEIFSLAGSKKIMNAEFLSQKQLQKLQRKWRRVCCASTQSEIPEILSHYCTWIFILTFTGANEQKAEIGGKCISLEASLWDAKQLLRKQSRVEEKRNPIEIKDYSTLPSGTKEMKW